jgi:hypothetical protein
MPSKRCSAETAEKAPAPAVCANSGRADRLRGRSFLHFANPVILDSKRSTRDKTVRMSLLDLPDRAGIIALSCPGARFIVYTEICFMPIFVCLRGDCDNIAFTEDNCFAMQDTQNRNWICYQTGSDELPDLAIQAATLMTIQHKLAKQGLATNGSASATHLCAGVNELREALGRSL